MACNFASHEVDRLHFQSGGQCLVGSFAPNLMQCPGGVTAHKWFGIAQESYQRRNDGSAAPVSGSHARVAHEPAASDAPYGAAGKASPKRFIIQCQQIQQGRRGRVPI